MLISIFFPNLFIGFENLVWIRLLIFLHRPTSAVGLLISDSGSICLLLQRSLAGREAAYHVSLYPLWPGRRHRPWQFALRFQLSYGYFHIRISGPKFCIRISSYRLTTLCCHTQSFPDNIWICWSHDLWFALCSGHSGICSAISNRISNEEGSLFDTRSISTRKSFCTGSLLYFVKYVELNCCFYIWCAVFNAA